MLPKFFNGKDITDNKYFWIFAFPFGYIFLVFVSKWVKKFYHNSLYQAEELLKELENTGESDPGNFKNLAEYQEYLLKDNNYNTGLSVSFLLSFG